MVPSGPTKVATETTPFNPTKGATGGKYSVILSTGNEILVKRYLCKNSLTVCGTATVLKGQPFEDYSLSAALGQ